MLDDKLKKIIEDKEFNSFWEMFFTLQHNWGYRSIDAFGICLNYYTDTQIWEDVAFLNGKRIEVPTYHGHADPIMGGMVDVMRNNRVHIEIVVGVINEKTKHLRGLFNYYFKCKINGGLRINDGEISEIEGLCDEIYHFADLPHIITDYLNHSAALYYGTEIKDLDKIEMLCDLMKNEEIRKLRNY